MFINPIFIEFPSTYFTLYSAIRFLFLLYINLFRLLASSSFSTHCLINFLLILKKSISLLRFSFILFNFITFFIFSYPLIQDSTILESAILPTCWIAMFRSKSIIRRWLTWIQLMNISYFRLLKVSLIILEWISIFSLIIFFIQSKHHISSIRFLSIRLT